MKNQKNQDNIQPSNDHEASRKKRNSSNSNNNNAHQDLEELQFAKRRHDVQQDDNDFLTLSLTFGQDKSMKPSSQPQLSVPLSSPFPLVFSPQREAIPQSPQSQPLTSPSHLSSSLSLMVPNSHSPPSIQAPQLEALTATSSLSSILAAAAAAAAAAPIIPDQPPLCPGPSVYRREVAMPRPSRPPRARRSHIQAPRQENEPFPPPYPWAAEKKAAVRSLEELAAKEIEIITGMVQCKRCERQFEMGFNLREKFLEVGSFIAENKESMHDRAPSVWMSPVLPTCKFCEQENSVKPMISEKKKSINWLFLLLGQMLGCCTLDQLKYFCKHTDNHRTGAKDRVLYLTYLALCKQLDPDGPFDR